LIERARRVHVADGQDDMVESLESEVLHAADSILAAFAIP
jgi:hypothetical protein